VLRNLWIAGEQELKSAIQPKTFHLVGADPSTGRIFGLQQFDGHAGLLQTHSAAEAGESRPYDRYIGHDRQCAIASARHLAQQQTERLAHSQLSASFSGPQ
jgi:hypothetical protein